MPLPPKAELEWWYQFYFATERGRIGYEANRNKFNKLIYWNEVSKGGHFAAWEEPELFSAEMRAAFRSLRQPA